MASGAHCGLRSLKLIDQVCEVLISKAAGVDCIAVMLLMFRELF